MLTPLGLGSQLRRPSPAHLGAPPELPSPAGDTGWPVLTCPSCRPRVQIGCPVSSRTLTHRRHPIYPSASLGTAVGGQTRCSPSGSSRSSHLRDLSAPLSPPILPSSLPFLGSLSAFTKSQILLQSPVGNPPRASCAHTLRRDFRGL